MVSVDPEAETEEQAGDDEDPDGRGGFGVDEAGLVGLVGGAPGADGVGDVVAAVRDGHHHGRGDLGVGPEMLDFVVVYNGFGVGGGEVLRGVRDAVAGHALEYEEFGPGPDTLWVVEGETGSGQEETLVRAHEFLVDWYWSSGGGFWVSGDICDRFLVLLFAG